MGKFELPRQYLNCQLYKEDGSEGDIDKEDRTVKIIASDETPIDRIDFYKWEQYKLILSHEEGHINLNRVDNQVCLFFDNHPGVFSSSSRLGKVKKAEVIDKKLILTIKLNRGSKADEYLRDIEDGTEPGNSVGIDIHKIEVLEKAVYEDNDGFNRRKLIKPALMKAIDWELCEISAVDVPANPNAGRFNFDKNNISQVEVIDNFSEDDMSKNIEQQTQESKPDTTQLEIERLNKLIDEYEAKIKKVSVENQYLLLRNKAFGYLIENKLSFDDFDKCFKVDVHQEFERLSKLDDVDSRVELKVLERTIELNKKEPGQGLTEEQKKMLNNNSITQTKPDGVVGNGKSNGLNNLSIEDTAKFIVEGL